jgi:hypothetical protein
MNNQGQYVTLSETPDGDLLIRLTADGRELLDYHAREVVVDTNQPVHTLMEPVRLSEVMTEFDEPHYWLWAELLDDIRANSDIEMLSPYTDDYVRLGHLTSAPIIATGVYRDCEGHIEEVDKQYWFPNYVVESELATLLSNGQVIFDGAN